MSHPFYKNVLKLAKEVYAKESKSKLVAPFASDPLIDKPNEIESLEPFITGGLGNFPYYWQDPRNNLFNIDTYNWISANVKAGAYPIEQASGSSFTNLSIDALGAVSYSISTADEHALTADSLKIFNAQSTLLTAWENAFGNIPPGTPTQPPIDIIIILIANTWASPATNFEEMLNAAVLNDLLNEVPPSGTAVMPVLANYINVINASISLQNASPSQTGYLNAALKALQFPSLANGGLETNDREILPAYEVTTPLLDILEGLKDTANDFTLNLKITGGEDAEIHVGLPGGESFHTDVDSFLAMPTASGQNVFKSILENHADPIEVELAFSGLTMVYFGPVPFKKSSSEYWFWKEPLIGAVQNGKEDITGFKFAPTPSIDFSKQGPYGFLTAVAISNLPNIYIKLPASKNKSTTNFFQKITGEIKLMGNSMKGEVSPISIQQKTKTKEVDQSLALLLSPAIESTPGIDSRAWVHGVLVDYPVAVAEDPDGVLS